ncbi:MAG: hypothetical protein H6741_00105 [Alphaproteobacteria bacterium]|nr:hypothetical protein [Alphaproteobacteria bacterium]MCB9791106.1 hypothetical protein [Alphaproteobacteria bacterium]
MSYDLDLRAPSPIPREAVRSACAAALGADTLAWRDGDQHLTVTLQVGADPGAVSRVLLHLPHASARFVSGSGPARARAMALARALVRLGFQGSDPQLAVRLDAGHPWWDEHLPRALWCLSLHARGWAVTLTDLAERAWRLDLLSGAVEPVESSPFEADPISAGGGREACREGHRALGEARWRPWPAELPPATRVATAPDGRGFALGHAKGLSFVAADGAVLGAEGRLGELAAVAFSPDGEQVFAGSRGGTASLRPWPGGRARRVKPRFFPRIWEDATGRPVASSTQADRCTGAAWLPNGHLVVGWRFGLLQVFDHQLAWRGGLAVTPAGFGVDVGGPTRVGLGPSALIVEARTDTRVARETWPLAPGGLEALRRVVGASDGAGPEAPHARPGAA